MANDDFSDGAIPEWLSRSKLLLGAENLLKLKSANVLVVGLGGVGAAAAEMICRSGVGRMTIIDADRIEETNLNRQLPAKRSTLGALKAEVVAERLRDIHPEAEITALDEFLRDERADEVLGQGFDYVIDAIDTLSPKVFLLASCVRNEIPAVTALGSAGKMDPALVEVADISKSYQCGLARALRKRLHRMGIRTGIKAVFSPEPVPSSAVLELEENSRPNQRSIVGTISYMPAVFGCFCASAVIRDLIHVRK